MITVTRINDTRLVINADLIEFVEETPDTIISLTTGKKVIVRETIDEIIELVSVYQTDLRARSKLRAAGVSVAEVDNG